MEAGASSLHVQSKSGPSWLKDFEKMGGQSNKKMSE